MNGIEQEKARLLAMAEHGELPSYPQEREGDSFFTGAPVTGEITEYFSGENDALERALEQLWANDPSMKKCIPLILATVEKSRRQKTRALLSTELYNYTM